ncbi:uncharacterized protein ACIB01_006904 [Guaruba guarouba]
MFQEREDLLELWEVMGMLCQDYFSESVLKTCFVMLLRVDPGVVEKLLPVWFCVRRALRLWGPRPCTRVCCHNGKISTSQSVELAWEIPGIPDCIGWDDELEAE